MKMTRKASVQDTQQLLERLRSERDQAIQRHNDLKEKLRQYESRTKTTESVKQKLKTLTVENKELKRQVKTLRAEIGLESSPSFQGKTTKDIISDLQEKERVCDALVEKTASLNLTIDELSSELANTVTSKTLLEEKVQSLQINLRDMSSNQRRLLKLWEKTKAQRDPILLPPIAQRNTNKTLPHKAVQTDTSISYTHVPETTLRWEPERNPNLERRNVYIANGGHLL